MKNILICILFCIVFVNPSFSQLGVLEDSSMDITFMDITDSITNKDDYLIVDENSEPYAMLLVNASMLKRQDLLILEKSNNKPLIFKSLSPNFSYQLLYIENGTTSIKVSHPIGEAEFKFPHVLESGRIYEITIRDINTGVACLAEGEHNHDNANSYNVTVFDKEGNSYSTGLYISMSGKSYVRIRSGLNRYEQYVLKEADKEEFTYMTTGESEIEPLYIK